MAQVQYRSKQDAGIVREKKTVIVERELDKLYKKEGMITPASILDSARAATSPLHGFFEWDDAKAGEKWRLTQAMEMIMATKFMVILKEEKGRLPQVVAAEPVRKFLPQFGGKGFKMRNEALAAVDNRQEIVDRKLGQLRSWCNGVIDIPELESIRKLIESQLAS
jgi:hypothetical protein